MGKLDKFIGNFAVFSNLSKRSIPKPFQRFSSLAADSGKTPTSSKHDTLHILPPHTHR
jgi:hypothetical protein